MRFWLPIHSRSGCIIPDLLFGSIIIFLTISATDFILVSEDNEARQGGELIYFSKWTFLISYLANFSSNIVWLRYGIVRGEDRWIWKNHHAPQLGHRKMSLGWNAQEFLRHLHRGLWVTLFSALLCLNNSSLWVFWYVDNGYHFHIRYLYLFSSFSSLLAGNWWLFSWGCPFPSIFSYFFI